VKLTTTIPGRREDAGSKPNEMENADYKSFLDLAFSKEAAKALVVLRRERSEINERSIGAGEIVEVLATWQSSPSAAVLLVKNKDGFYGHARSANTVAVSSGEK